jgi:hypothetical protein
MLELPPLAPHHPITGVHLEADRDHEVNLPELV